MCDRAHKHNSTMVSDASPGTVAPNMNNFFVHMAHVSSERAFAQDGYLNVPIRPVLMEISGRTVVGFWFLGDFASLGNDAWWRWRQNRRNRIRRWVFLHDWTLRINRS
jgi:hypothetical protein